MSLWHQGRDSRRRKHPETPLKQRRLSAGIERLEDRMLMSADGLVSLTSYDAGAAYIDPLWFQQIGQSNASRSTSGITTLEQTTDSIAWKGQIVDIYLDEWIVQLTRDAAERIGSMNDAAGLLNAAGLGIEVIGGLGLEGQLLVRAAGVSAEALGQWFGSADCIAYYEPNAILPVKQSSNDPSGSQTWGLNNTGQSVAGQTGTSDADIDAAEAWNLTTGSNSVVVGIIDSGIDYTHPDLAANIWTNPGEIAGNGIDDDGNGFVDDVHGYDFVNNDGDPMDDQGHGTHVAGTIAAAGNNGVGVAGVAWSTSLMAMKFLDSTGAGSLYDAVRAINYATMMRSTYGVNICVTNNSWGGGGYSQSLYDAIKAHGQAGILFVAAAGNDGSNNDATASYPSSYALDNVIAVAATDNRDQLASFSNYGSTSVDLAAPGVGIYSTQLGGGYRYMSGTSMATPHVAGAAALCYALNPNASVAQVRSAIFAGVDHVSSLSGKVATGGRLNALGALEQMGMRVVSSTPDAGGIVNTSPTSFTIDLSQAFDPASVQAADFRVNGIAANSVTVVDGNTLTFRFNASPVTTQGTQTMAIAAGAISRADGQAFTGWQATFQYDATPMTVVSTTPGENQTTCATPTSILIRLNEAVDASSLNACDLVLSVGTVTGAELVDANTIRYAISLPTHQGSISYTLAAGTLRDVYGNASPSAYTGRFTVSDPSVVCYKNTTPVAVPDLGTITSTIAIADNLTIYDLDVELTIAHKWMDDLDVYLIAPDGTRVELVTDVGRNGQGYTNTIFDDQATQAIGSGSAPYTGRFRAEGSLSVLNGKSTAGVWRLEISDDYKRDTGTLSRWSLQFRLNGPPVIATIADRSMSHGTDAIVVPISASDPDGGRVELSARAVSAAYYAGQTTDPGSPSCAVVLTVDPATGRLTVNPPANYVGTLYVEVMASDGTATSRTMFAVNVVNEPVTLAPIADQTIESDHSITLPLTVTNSDGDPLTYTARAVARGAAVDVAVSFDAQHRLTLTPPAGFAGAIDVEVLVSDGASTARQTFCLTVVSKPVVNQPVTLEPIADMTVPAGQDSIVVPLVVSNPDGDRVTYSATAVISGSSTAYEVDQQYGLWVDATRLKNNYYYNATGRQEKWLLSGDGRIVCILPNGELRISNGSMFNTTLIARVDPSCHADPSLLWNAQPGRIELPVSFDAEGRLTITLPEGCVGPIDVAVTVTDSAGSASQSFQVNVAKVDQAPTIGPIADVTVASGSGPIVVAIPVTNPDGDPLSYSATTVGQGTSAAYQLDQQYRFWAEASRVARNYDYNVTGRQEKWLLGGDGRLVCILPSGEVRQVVTSMFNTKLLGRVDSSCHADPSLLWNAQPAEANVAVSVDAQGRVTVVPPAGFTGDIQVSVKVSDGRFSDTRSFAIHVTPATTTAAAAQVASLSRTPFISPTAAVRRDQVSEAGLGLLVAERTGQSFQQLADQVFERLEATRLAALEFEIE